MELVMATKKKLPPRDPKTGRFISTKKRTSSKSSKSKSSTKKTRSKSRTVKPPSKPYKVKMTKKEKDFWDWLFG